MKAPWSAGADLLVAAGCAGRREFTPTRFVFGLTDTGRSREKNEDAFCMDRAGRVLAVADGVGGLPSGEEASRIAAAAAASYVAVRLASMHETAQAGDLAVEALLAADHAIAEACLRFPARSGMAAAVTTAFMGRGTLEVASLGDVRCYIMRAGTLALITVDQTPLARMVRAGLLTEEELRRHPERNVIDQAAGLPPVSPSHVSVPLQEKDKVLLCSDGVWSALRAGEIERILHGEGSVRQLGTQLLNHALAADGSDNLTLILYEQPPLTGEGL